MFKTPFSFNGRIRRLEYGLTLIIYYAVIFLIGGASATVSEDVGSILVIVLYIPLIWFMLAQGSKRCHDLDKTGWFQIIPFYVLWMLFQDGQPDRNGYGSSPKFPETSDILDSETLDGHMKN
jgi:uncharacterized membrane protein YhaH (DUF805 family)